MSKPIFALLNFCEKVKNDHLAKILFNLPIKFKSAKTLANWHFYVFSRPRHVNRKGLTQALILLENKPALILETGTSAWGTDSTRLWAKYVNSFGGEFWSVDIRVEASISLGDLGPKVHLITSDSVEFLRHFSDQKDIKIDLAYLDSWDVDWSNPTQSAFHGYKEWEALQPLLKSGSIVLIDDTPRAEFLPPGVETLASKFISEFGVFPGKGAFILRECKLRSDVEILHHEYNLILRIL